MGLDLSNIMIKDIYYIVSVKLNENEKIYKQDRVRSGLVLALSGKVTYNCNGKASVLDKNHIVLLPKGSTYTALWEENCVCPMVDFTTDNPLEITEIMSFYIGNSKKFLNIFNRLDNLWTFKKSCYKLRCMAGLYELLAELHGASGIRYHSNSNYDKIRQSIDYLEAYYNEPIITNELLASKSKISTIYFRKIFTDLYGVPPMKYVLMKRIEKAKDMLKTEITNITNISRDTGFSSIYYFCQTFKKITSYTPSEYRKLLIDKNKQK